MNSTDPKEKILSEYEKNGNEIIQKMLNVIARAQQKVDNKTHREVLGKVKKS